jgi:hypothetical protein
MYLSQSQKRQIMKSFSELEEKIDSYGRCSYKLKYKDVHRKEIAREFSHTGNGYVYGVDLPDYSKLADSRGWVNIRDFSETKLRDIVTKAINYYGGSAISLEINSPRVALKEQTFVKPDNTQAGQITNVPSIKHRIIRNIITYKQSDLKQRDFWAKKCEGFESGIYIYQFDNTSIPYPYNFNEVFYIGKAKNLAERLLHHFTVDNRLKLIEGKQCLEWFYQNYYQSKKHSFNIRIFSTSLSEVDQMESLLIGMFALKFGAAPICNSNVSREKFKRNYELASRSIKQLVGNILDLIS